MIDSVLVPVFSRSVFEREKYIKRRESARSRPRKIRTIPDNGFGGFAGIIGHFHYIRMMADYYRHFKGGKYKLLGIAKDSETLEKMVVYQALYGEGDLWVRPYEMFFGTVERDGRVIQRFTNISEEEAL